MPTLMHASFIRFCADGTLRGSDNYVVARCTDGLWIVGGRTHRELECDGPVRVRVIARAGDASETHGPFKHLRTLNGILHAGDMNLHVGMPGRVIGNAVACHEVAFLS